MVNFKKLILNDVSTYCQIGFSSKIAQLDLSWKIPVRTHHYRSYRNATLTGQLGNTFLLLRLKTPSVKQGCRVATSEISGSLECLCGVGCHKEFPFKTRTECEASLKGEYVCYSSYTYGKKKINKNVALVKL